MNTQTTNDIKHQYVGYTRKEKFLPTVLLSLFAPITVFFLGPFEIYGNNSDEFKFVLTDFVGFCLLLTLAAAFLIFDVLTLLRGRAYDIAFGLIFGLSFMLFLQGNYLSLGMNSLAGDGVGDVTLSTAKTVVNLIIWCVVILGSVAVMLLLNKYKDTVRLISIVALSALLGMSLISFLAVSLSTDVYSTEKTQTAETDELGQEILTVKNLDTFALKDNIIVFIVDRFDHSYYESARDEYPEIFDELDGFTYFDDYVTLYPRTYPAVVYTLTGIENDFKSSREEYMAHAYGNSEYLEAIQSAGYDINIYTDTYYGYENAAYMSKFTSNSSADFEYEVVSNSNLSLDMIRLSLYRYLPFAFRDAVGNISTPTFDKYIEYDSDYDIYSTDMKDVYNAFTQDEFTFRDSEKGFSFIHIAGCHLANKYDEDFNLAEGDERWDISSAMKQSFKIISAYIREMKRMGVYEDATIIITGDHASIGSDTEDPYYPHITSLFIKPSGKSEGDIAVSHAQLSQNEVFATVLDAAGSDHAADYGTPVFEVSENANTKRRYLFHRYVSGNYEVVEYEINGNSHVFENWRIVNRYDLGKSIYD